MKDVLDPIKFQKLMWPHINFYDKQKEIIYSVVENDETFVPAGNELGKDFVAGFIVVWFFMAHRTVRIVTTSVKDDHLRVLWGEIGRFIRTAKSPLSVIDGGPWICNQREIKKIVNGRVCEISYLIGKVSEKGEGMAGHHAPYTLYAIDEASGVVDTTYTQCGTWAKKGLIFGNTNPCENFFKVGVKGGNILSDDGKYKHRNVIKITAEDSPNVRLARAEIANGEEPSHKIIVPGVKQYSTLLKHRKLWDRVRQCIGLDAEFYEGPEALLFPPEWLNNSERLAASLSGRSRKAKTIGVDPAEGGDNSTWAVCDELGLIKLISMKTPDTTYVVNQTIALIREYNVLPKNVWFDRGGGGKQHADRLRSQGHRVNSISFGSAASPPKRRIGMVAFDARVDDEETRSIYKNKRAEIYGLLSDKVNPANETPFSIPAEYTELRRQLLLTPRLYDGEGQLWLPPKSRGKSQSKDKTIHEIMGCSPDEADALALGAYGLYKKSVRVKIGVIPGT